MDQRQCAIVGSVALQHEMGCSSKTGLDLGLTLPFKSRFRSDVERRIGTSTPLTDTRIDPPIVASPAPRLRYEDLLFTFNQLLGDEWSLGARYQVTRSTITMSSRGARIVVVHVSLNYQNRL
jgi:hypothetical protein